VENGITKKQSAVLQGVAILMMVYHHLFSFAVEYESLLPFIQVDTARRIAWFCKLCVGIFAFVSGYGMYYVMKRQDGERFGRRLLAEYRESLLRIVRLYGKLWLVLAIYMGIFFGLLKQPFMPEQFVGNLTALDPTYNGAWWYVEQYAKILLMLPLLDLLLTHFEQPGQRRVKWIFFLVLAVAGVGAMAVGLIWWPGLWELLLALLKSMRISFLLIAAVGYLTARYALYQRVDRCLRRLGGWAPVCVSVILLVFVVVLRVRLATDAAYAKVDFLLTPLLVYGLLTLLYYVEPLCTFLAWWGRQSTYIWLVHGFVFGFLYLVVKPIVQLDIGVYLAVLLASAAVAFPLRLLEKLPGRLYAFCKKRTQK